MNARVLPHLNLAEGWAPRLALLIGQSLALGISLSLTAILANALFLADFGAQTLPYVYIVVAPVGLLLTYSLAAAQRRLALARLAGASVALLSVFYLLCWLGITLAGMRWLSFPLVVSFALVIQIGFVFLGGQAGRLFDLRQIKRFFPLIVAGFVVGFFLGGLIAPALIRLTGSAENALVGMVASSLAWLAFLVLTGRRYHSELGGVDAGAGKPAQSLRRTLAKRYVLLIFAYLLLAMMVSVLSDYLLMAQAGARYTSAGALAGFLSSFTVGLNLTDLLFTTLIAGVILSRFGLNTGLLANPLVMALVFGALVVSGLASGLSSALFFGLVVAARIANITLNDGMTRASTNAAYQALPPQERVLVQTGVEGAGGLLAEGVVGVLLLVFNAIPGLTLLHIVLLTLLLAVAWLGVSSAVYRSYKGSLADVLRRQALSEGDDLYLEDAAAQAALQNMLGSERINDVRLALDLLERRGDPALDAHLLALLARPDPAARLEALTRIERRRTPGALAQAAAALQAETDPAARAAALRALCALSEGDADERAVAHLDDAQPDLRRAAMVGLLRYGGIPGALAAGRRLLALESSPHAPERLFLAQVIGEVGAPSLYRPLAELLQDPDREVRRAAAIAAGRLRHPALLEALAAALDDPSTRSAAVDGLSGYGAAALPAARQALAAGPAGEARLARLLRLCAQAGGEEVLGLLKGLLDHPADEVRARALAGLRRLDYRPAAAEIGAIERAIQQEVERAVRLLAAARNLGEAEGLAALQRALDGELQRVRERVFLLLSFLYDAHTLLRAGERLSVGSESEQALALEVLEVTLSAAHKARLMALVNPRLSAAQRLQQLGRPAAPAGRSRDDQLQELIADPLGAWGAVWLRACAVYAAGALPAAACRPAVERLAAHPDAVIQETAAWALARL